MRVNSKRVVGSLAGCRLMRTETDRLCYVAFAIATAKSVTFTTTTTSSFSSKLCLQTVIIIITCIILEIRLPRDKNIISVEGGVIYII